MNNFTLDQKTGIDFIVEVNTATKKALARYLSAPAVVMYLRRILRLMR